MEGFLRDKLRFMLITDRHVVRQPLTRVIEEALRAGFTSVQLREKDLSAAELYLLAIEIRKITRAHDALFIVNDRVDVALAAEADGVHLGWRSLDPVVVRDVVNSDGPFLIGASTHNIVEVRRVLHAHVDYLIYGPLFPTPSKEGLVDSVGVQSLKKIAVPSPVPVIGVGGIDATNVSEVYRARATGAAFIRAVMEASDPYAAARKIVESAPEPLPAPADQAFSR